MEKLPTAQSGYNALSPQQQKDHRTKIGVNRLRQKLRLEEETGRLFWIAGRRKGREAFTAMSKDGYRVGLVERRQYPAHHVVWALHYGEWPVAQIDHANRDRADNRPSNLRAATHQQNMRNKAKSEGGRSRFIGVQPSGQKWTATIGENGTKRHLGTFPTETAAARAYDRAAMERDSQFVYTNFGGRDA